MKGIVVKTETFFGSAYDEVKIRIDDKYHQHELIMEVDNLSKYRVGDILEIELKIHNKGQNNLTN